MKYTIKHTTCCSNLDEEIIEGTSLESALDRYAHEWLPLNGSCDLEVTDENGEIRKFYVNKIVKCGVYES